MSTELGAIVRSPATPEVTGFTARAEMVLWEEHLQEVIEEDPGLDVTEKQALVLARRGQGRFRDLVSEQELRCRITRVDRPEHLRASHCKPWRDSTNAERLDPNNGLLLTPSIDHLFDRGFISFEDTGRVLLSPVAHRPSLQRMGVAVDRCAFRSI
jgi:predicted restriction endonuclease